MLYVQFFQLSTGYVAGSIPPRFDAAHKTAIPATGDRGVVVLDARNSRETHKRIAAAECKKRGYVAWQLFAGETFTRSRPLSQVETV